MEDVKSWAKQPYVGSVETAVAPFWRLLRSISPGVRVVVIRRPIQEVERSLRGVMTQAPDNLSYLLRRWDAKLEQVSRRVPGTLSVTYADLATREGASRVFEHALQAPFDEAWWRILAPVNLQEPFATFERYAVAYLPQMTRMAQIARGNILREMQLQPSHSMEGIEFQEEPFETFYHDGVEAFGEHLLAVGETPAAFSQKNIPLLQLISDAGAMQIVTARSNGRMFGYLMSELMPSREMPNRIAAVETIFYASADFPGLGMKLQRETLRRLRAKNVAEVWFRQGIRGNGPKTSVMYKRIGAEPSGSLWRLDLSGEGIL